MHKQFVKSLTSYIRYHHLFEHVQCNLIKQLNRQKLFHDIK